MVAKIKNSFFKNKFQLFCYKSMQTSKSNIEDDFKRLSTSSPNLALSNKSNGRKVSDRSKNTITRSSSATSDSDNKSTTHRSLITTKINKKSKENEPNLIIFSDTEDNTKKDVKPRSKSTNNNNNNNNLNENTDRNVNNGVESFKLKILSKSKKVQQNDNHQNLDQNDFQQQNKQQNRHSYPQNNHLSRSSPVNNNSNNNQTSLYNSNSSYTSLKQKKLNLMNKSNSLSSTSSSMSNPSSKTNSLEIRTNYTTISNNKINQNQPFKNRTLTLKRSILLNSKNKLISSSNAKKVVRFADSLGLELESVITMANHHLDQNQTYQIKRASFNNNSKCSNRNNLFTIDSNNYSNVYNLKNGYIDLDNGYSQFLEMSLNSNSNNSKGENEKNLNIYDQVIDQIAFVNSLQNVDTNKFEQEYEFFLEKQKQNYNQNGALTSTSNQFFTNKNEEINNNFLRNGSNVNRFSNKNPVNNNNNNNNNKFNNLNSLNNQQNITIMTRINNGKLESEV